MHVFRSGGLTVLSLGLLVLAPVSTASAAGPTVEAEYQRGPLVNANFSTIDESGCIDTETFVTANLTTDRRNDASGNTGGTAGVDVFQYDLCTDTVLLQLAGFTESLDPADFAVSNQLDWATLHTSITVDNIDTGETSEVAVDVAWSGTSDITRNHSNTNEVYPGCHVLNRWTGSGREASAAGTVTQGEVNFAPDPSQSAEIGFVHDGFVVIGCF